MAIAMGGLILALSGCSSPWGCTDTTAERGEAGAKVEVEDISGQPLGVTAEVVDWRLEPHPQVPAEGDRVHFHYLFDGADERSGPRVDACAVDKDRVALGCQTVYSSEAWREPDGALTGDDWLVVEHPEQVAGVLFIPNDRSYGRRTCEQDIKDGGGTHPPGPAGMGDQL
uniref:Lipoprotein n=1 Tax=Streptomyces sp. NBC_00003 TaxID=2903608 RepID=A0AAU2VGV6_9ACTN